MTTASCPWRLQNHLKVLAKAQQLKYRLCKCQGGGRESLNISLHTSWGLVPSLESSNDTPTWPEIQL